MKTIKNKKGFTLIELLVVIGIIGVLASIVIIAMSNSRDKARDSKIMSQMSQMNSQALLFKGAVATTATATVPAPFSITSASTGGIPGASADGTASSGTLFNAMASTHNSLFPLIKGMPVGTRVYYGWNRLNPSTTGNWFFVAALSDGAFCNDSRGIKKRVTGNPPSTLAQFTAYFPTATSAQGYRCD